MRAWCPRCDAVRPGQTVCPVCQTTLATLDDTAPDDQQPGLAPPDPAPAPPTPPPRLRIALAAATLVVAGLAFVAGRSIARPAAPAAAPAPATSTTAPEPGADQRQLGWTARAGGLTVTAVEASRLATERHETVASITFRVEGVPGDQRVLGLRGLSLLDSGGGVFASVDQRQFGREGGAPVLPVEGQEDTYRVVTGPAPRLSSLARIKLTGVVVVRPRDQTIQLDTSGPWPPGPGLRAVDPGQRDAVDDRHGLLPAAADPARAPGDLGVRARRAGHGGGRRLLGLPGRARRVPAHRRRAARRRPGPVLADLGAGRGPERPGVQGLVLSCPTRPVPRLTVAVGVGARMLPLEATLRP